MKTDRVCLEACTVRYVIALEDEKQRSYEERVPRLVVETEIHAFHARAIAIRAKVARVPPAFTSNVANLTTAHKATMLPDEIIAQLNAEFQCREQQLQHLVAIYSVRLRSHRHDVY